MATKAITGFKLSVDKSGKTTLVKAPRYASVSAKIQAAKSKRVRVARR